MPRVKPGINFVSKNTKKTTNFELNKNVDIDVDSLEFFQFGVGLKSSSFFSAFQGNFLPKPITLVPHPTDTRQLEFFHNQSMINKFKNSMVNDNSTIMNSTLMVEVAYRDYDDPPDDSAPWTYDYQTFRKFSGGLLKFNEVQYNSSYDRYIELPPFTDNRQVKHRYVVGDESGIINDYYKSKWSDVVEQNVSIGILTINKTFGIDNDIKVLNNFKYKHTPYLKLNFTASGNVDPNLQKFDIKVDLTYRPLSNIGKKKDQQTETCYVIPSKHSNPGVPVNNSYTNTTYAQNVSNTNDFVKYSVYAIVDLNNPNRYLESLTITLRIFNDSASSTPIQSKTEVIDLTKDTDLFASKWYDVLTGSTKKTEFSIPVEKEKEGYPDNYIVEYLGKVTPANTIEVRPYAAYYKGDPWLRTQQYTTRPSEFTCPFNSEYIIRTKADDDGHQITKLTHENRHYRSWEYGVPNVESLVEHLGIIGGTYIDKYTTNTGRTVTLNNLGNVGWHKLKINVATDSKARYNRICYVTDSKICDSGYPFDWLMSLNLLSSYGRIVTIGRRSFYVSVETHESYIARLKMGLITDPINIPNNEIGEFHTDMTATPYGTPGTLPLAGVIEKKGGRFDILKRTYANLQNTGSFYLMLIETKAPTKHAINDNEQVFRDFPLHPHLGNNKHLDYINASLNKMLIRSKLIDKNDKNTIYNAGDDYDREAKLNQLSPERNPDSSPIWNIPELDLAYYGIITVKDYIDAGGDGYFNMSFRVKYNGDEPEKFLAKDQGFPHDYFGSDLRSDLYRIIGFVFYFQGKLLFNLVPYMVNDATFHAVNDKLLLNNHQIDTAPLRAGKWYYDYYLSTNERETISGFDFQQCRFGQTYKSFGNNHNRDSQIQYTLVKKYFGNAFHIRIPNHTKYPAITQELIADNVGARTDKWNTSNATFLSSTGIMSSLFVGSGVKRKNTVSDWRQYTYNYPNKTDLYLYDKIDKSKGMYQCGIYSQDQSDTQKGVVITNTQLPISWNDSRGNKELFTRLTPQELIYHDTDTWYGWPRGQSSSPSNLDVVLRLRDFPIKYSWLGRDIVTRTKNPADEYTKWKDNNGPYRFMNGEIRSTDTSMYNNHGNANDARFHQRLFLSLELARGTMDYITNGLTVDEMINYKPDRDWHSYKISTDWGNC